jgi:hypothetical protein
LFDLYFHSRFPQRFAADEPAPGFSTFIFVSSG